MRVRHLKSLVLLSALAAAACGGKAATPRPVGASARVITSDDIAGTRANNLYEAIQFLRPGWLRRQGPLNPQDDGLPVVYLNDTRLGPPESLRVVNSRLVTHVRYLDPVAAHAQFGMNHGHGVIHVVLEAGR
jgi:hypothetical protein